MGKDYYKILGVEKNATTEEIKKAFRKLAHQYHPDKQSGDEAKFKEINEAYQVIGNEQKRQQYDQFGSTFDQQGGFGGGVNWDDFMKYARQGGGGGYQNINVDFGDLGDIFGDIFGFGGGGARRSRGGRRVVQGDDLQMRLTLEFKEAIFGVKKEISIAKNIKCDHCHGNLAEPGTPIKTCSACGGSGQVVKVQRTMFGAFQSAVVCSACNGEGKIPEKKCTVCRGQGITKQEKTLEIEIPAGVSEGMTLRLAGQGDVGLYGGPAGDLYVHLKVKEDPRFERNNDDIITRKEISFVNAILGTKLEVDTLDGVVDLNIPEGTQPGARFRIKGKGVPKMRGAGRGDFYVDVVVEIPKKISRQQKKLLLDFEAD